MLRLLRGTFIRVQKEKQSAANLQLHHFRPFSFVKQFIQLACVEPNPFRQILREGRCTKAFMAGIPLFNLNVYCRRGISRYKESLITLLL